MQATWENDFIGVRPDDYGNPTRWMPTGCAEVRFHSNNPNESAWLATMLRDAGIRFMGWPPRDFIRITEFWDTIDS